MSHFDYTIIVGWESRNRRNKKRAEIWCKDYGLKPILKNLYIGRVRADQRENLRKLFADLFLNKTEKIFLGTFCDSCEKILNKNIREKTKRPIAFEIITTVLSREFLKKPIK
jgi:hypothetical protein